MRSLIKHMSVRDGLREDGPSYVIRNKILLELEREYKTAKWCIPDDFMQESHYRRVLMTVNWQASPGYPYCMDNPVNKDLFAVKDGIPNEDQVLRFWQLVQTQINMRRADYIKLFIKGEPLKQAKIDSKSYRLISSVSIVDQLIDKMLFDDMNSLMIEKFHYLPSKVGWSQYSGGWITMPRQPWLAIDKSKWDWSVTTWLLDLELEFRKNQCLNMNPQWVELATWRYQMLFGNPTFVTSAGHLLRQRHPGVMKSGCVNTIATNSILQVILHMRVSFELGMIPGNIMAMGDDTLQMPMENRGQYVDLLNQFSNVKHHILVNEFAGCRFQGRKVEPLYKGRHAFTLLHLDPKFLTQIADSYLLLYHRSSYRDWMEELISKLVSDPVSRRERDLIYDGTR